MIRRSLRLALVGLVLLASRAGAATYYVSNSVGSDANSCVAAQTLGTAKATVKAGVACASAGDTVQIKTGTYTTNNDVIDSNTFTVPSGSAGNLVHITGAGEDVTLRPANDVQIVRFQTGAPHYIEIRDITIDAVNTRQQAAIYQSGGAHHIRYFQIQLTRAYFFGALVVSSGGDFTGFNEFVNSEFDHTGDPLSTDNTRGHALYIETADNLIDGNYIHDNEGYGIQIDDNSLGTPPGTGAAYDLARNTVRNNRIYNNGLGHTTAYGVVYGRGDDGLIYNNKIYGNKGGISVYTFSRGLGVYNNTVVDNVDVGIAAQYYTTATIRNNIVYNNGLGVTDYGDINGMMTVTKDHNLETNPTFVNGTIHDYHLQSGSAAKDAGTTVAAFAVDFDGIARPQNVVWDIGAFEFVVASGDVTAPTVIISTNGGLNFYTLLASLSLDGTCTDDTACTDVQMTTDNCGSASASGTANWSVTLSLAMGTTCLVTMHGLDAASNDGHDTIEVSRLVSGYRLRHR